MESPTKAILLSNFDYFAQGKALFLGADLQVEKGELVFITGNTGSGKTSLFRLLIAELPWVNGQGSIAGFNLQMLNPKEIPFLRRKLGIIFQDFKLLADRSIYQNLVFVLDCTGWKSKKAIKERIKEIIELTKLEGKEERFPHELSIGEQQRVCVARALLNKPEIILADEPTASLDPENADFILGLLQQACQHGTTVVVATHQHQAIQRFGGTILHLQNGKIQLKQSLELNTIS